MKIEVTARNPDTGDVEFSGYLNRKEMSFLLHVGMTSLLADGVRFNLSHDEPNDDDEPRFEYPKDKAN